jgi:hypothetical protein
VAAEAISRFATINLRSGEASMALRPFLESGIYDHSSRMQPLVAAFWEQLISLILHGLACPHGLLCTTERKSTRGDQLRLATVGTLAQTFDFDRRLRAMSFCIFFQAS